MAHISPWTHPIYPGLDVLAGLGEGEPKLKEVIKGGKPLTRQLTVPQMEYQVRRAKRAQIKAGKRGDTATYERAGDTMANWQFEIAIAKGAKDLGELRNRMFGP